MEAVVLAGGLGARLRERMPGIPKAMAPVAGRPFLAWLFDELADAGFSRVILAVGHLGDAIRSCFGDEYRTLELLYAVETTPLGTGGAIRNGLAVAGSGDRPIWILNGDSILRLDFAKMWSAHSRRGGDPLAVTMAVTAHPHAARYGALGIEAGRVNRLTPAGGAGPALINAGVYLLN